MSPYILKHIDKETNQGGEVSVKCHASSKYLCIEIEFRKCNI